MTPACANCNATLAPYGPKGYDGPQSAMCDAQISAACRVDICSECAGFYEVDEDGAVARCRPCELERCA